MLVGIGGLLLVVAIGFHDETIIRVDVSGIVRKGTYGDGFGKILFLHTLPCHLNDDQIQSHRYYPDVFLDQKCSGGPVV
jgi:hypothetical protein